MSKPLSGPVALLHFGRAYSADFNCSSEDAHHSNSVVHRTFTLGENKLSLLLKIVKPLVFQR